MPDLLEFIAHIPVADVTAEAEDRLTLSYALRQRSRQRVVLESGREAGLFLSARTSILSGDQLRSNEGVHIVVLAADELLSDARTSDTLLLARACYHLGNRHVSLQVGPGWLRYEPDHVLDEMVRRLGLTVAAISAPFEPERGAYHAHPPSSSHRHDHPRDDERHESSRGAEPAGEQQHTPQGHHEQHQKIVGSERTP